MLNVMELRAELPYRSAVFAGGVPCLGTKAGATVAAHNPKRAFAVFAVAVPDTLTPDELGLHQFELHGVNHRFMAFLYVVLRNLTLIGLHLFQ